MRRRTETSDDTLSQPAKGNFLLASEFSLNEDPQTAVACARHTRMRSLCSDYMCLEEHAAATESSWIFPFSRISSCLLNNDSMDRGTHPRRRCHVVASVVLIICANKFSSLNFLNKLSLTFAAASTTTVWINLNGVYAMRRHWLKDIRFLIHDTRSISTKKGIYFYKSRRQSPQENCDSHKQISRIN